VSEREPFHIEDARVACREGVLADTGLQGTEFCLITIPTSPSSGLAGKVGSFKLCPQHNFSHAIIILGLNSFQNVPSKHMTHHHLSIKKMLNVLKIPFAEYLMGKLRNVFSANYNYAFNIRLGSDFKKFGRYIDGNCSHGDDVSEALRKNC
jgi:hypothetical protein